MSFSGACPRLRALRRLGGGGVVCALVLSACGTKSDVAASTAPTDAQYLAPPAVLAAALSPDGGVVLTGQGPGGAEVRLQAPDGAAFAAASGDDGAWSITLPKSSQPRMFAMEGDDAGRIVHAEGALLLLPAPGPRAILTRAGYGSLVIGAHGSTLRLQGLDFDGAGGGAASGLAPPGATVRLFLDRQPAGAGVADQDGRFTVLNLDPRLAPMTAGAHLFRVETAGGSAQETRFNVVDAAPPPGQVFMARREGDAWSVTWRIPGGGAQTSVIFDDVETAS